MLWRCYIFGHRRVYEHHKKVRVCRDGIMRLRDVTYAHCERCGDSDCYGYSLIEKVQNWWRDLQKQIKECYDPPPDDGLPF
jgi:hypothetical protein